METFNISSYFNGLGDSLQFSSFAEQLTKLGHEVNLYVGPEVLPYRNQSIKDFVWGHNPYIKGETKDNWNFGDLAGLPYLNATGAFIPNWARALGVPETDLLPKIYYQPKEQYRTELSFGTIEGIIELSGISMKNDYNKEAVIAAVQNIIKSKPNITFRQLCTPNQSNTIQIPDLPIIKANSLEDISDIIYNCKAFISLSSGSHSLAAAIRRFNPNFSQYCILPATQYDMFMTTKKFIYPDIIYLNCG